MNVSTGNAITGRSAFLALLKDEGVDTLFGNPGTTELPIMDALADHPDMGYVLALQESLVVAMADGYSRASGKLSACNVHVAPGLGNAMGALYTAKWVGSPIIITAGQQEQGHGLTEPLLYDPLVPIATPMVKWAVEVNRLEDLPRIMRRAAKVAMTPPTGPVFISLPGDILNTEGAIDMGARTRVEAASRPSDETLARLADRLLAAERPVIVAGHEVYTSDAFKALEALAERLGAAVYSQSVPHGTHFFSEHPAYIGGLSRVQAQVRGVLSDYDLMVGIGGDVLRMSVYSEVEALPEGMPVVSVCQNDWELGKNYHSELAVRGDVRVTIEALLPVIDAKLSEGYASAARQRLDRIAQDNWSTRRAALESRILAAPAGKPMNPDIAMLRFVEAVTPDAVVVDEGLITSRNLLPLLPIKDRHGFFGLASGGIGWAIAGSVGISLALPDRPVVTIIGDGSSMYSIQALWTAANKKLPITHVIANNRSYRIIKERLKAFHGNEHFVGMDFRDPPIDFENLARSMGLDAVTVDRPEDIQPAIRAGMESGRANLVNLLVEDGFGG